MDNGRVFTSLALMQLLLEPVAFLITALSGLMSAIGCFERIRIYLNSEVRDDSEDTETPPDYEALSLEHNGKLDNEDDRQFSEFRDTKASDVCISANMASCGWYKEGDPLLRNLEFEIKRGKLTMIIGPVSCGKTTLLKALLRETPHAAGFDRSGFQDAAYCAQTPWLTNGTVKENIMGDSNDDPKWFATVIRASALEADLKQFALGEHTVIGSKGLALSGGQQMRVVKFFKNRRFPPANVVIGSRKGSVCEERFGHP